MRWTLVGKIAELDVDARPDEERGREHADSRDVFLAHAPHRQREQNSEPDPTRDHPGPGERSIGDVNGEE